MAAVSNTLISRPAAETPTPGSFQVPQEWFDEILLCMQPGAGSRCSRGTAFSMQRWSS
jgi:hypothetical protein